MDKITNVYYNMAIHCKPRRFFIKKELRYIFGRFKIPLKIYIRKEISLNCHPSIKFAHSMRYTYNAIPFRYTIISYSLIFKLKEMSRNNSFSAADIDNIWRLRAKNVKVPDNAEQINLSTLEVNFFIEKCPRCSRELCDKTDTMRTLPKQKKSTHKIVKTLTIPISRLPHLLAGYS